MPGVGERSTDEDIDENVRLAQNLARDLRNARNARRSFEIGQELAKVFRELKEATSAERVGKVREGHARCRPLAGVTLL